MNMTILQRFKQAHTQQLTAEIAHKVLQPLTATTNYINGSLYYLKEAETSQEVIQALELATEQIKRSSDTMKSFRKRVPAFTDNFTLMINFCDFVIFPEIVTGSNIEPND